MRNYVAIIKYKDKESQHSMLITGTFEEVHQWVHNTLEIENVEFIIIQHMAIIESLKFEKNESETKMD